MEYKYPPIFKYIILLLCIFMFIKHLKIMVNHQNLMITISIIIMVMIFDYILINNHPDLLGNENKNENENFIESSLLNDPIIDKDIDDILENYNTDDLEKELNNDEDLQNLEYPNYKEKAFYQLPTDYRKPSYDLDIDCYRRGDGRGNTKPTQRYYAKDVL
jgi:hypothetical protein